MYTLNVRLMRRTSSEGLFYRHALLLSGFIDAAQSTQNGLQCPSRLPMAV
jgi:hypothetical protein